MSDYEEGRNDGYEDALSSTPTADNFSRKSGEAFWAFASFGTVQPSEEYLEGYDDGWEAGTEERRKSEDERDSRSSWFGSARDDTEVTDDDTEEDHYTTAGPATSEIGSGGYSGRGGGSGGGASGTNTGAGLGAVIALGLIIVVAGIWAIIHPKSERPNRNEAQVSFSAQQGTSPNLTLRENIGRFADYLRTNNQLMPAFTDYTLVMPPSVIKDADSRSSGSKSYEIAFVGPKSLYSFHSSDGGITWSPLPATDPYLRRLGDEYVNFVRNGKPLTNLISQVDAEMNPALRNDEVTVALPPYDWGSPPLSGSASRGGKPVLHWWLHNEIKGDPKLEGTIMSLAKAIQTQAFGLPITVYEYSQRGNDLWVAGDVSSGNGKTRSGDDYAMPRGFICHSADCGRSWVRQWLSDNMRPEPVYGIYFSDRSEGWGLSIEGILHTENGGDSWEKVFRADEWPVRGTWGGVENLFLLGKTDLLVITEWGSGHVLHYSRNRGRSWEKPGYPVAKDDRELNDVKKQFGSDVHYGGVYSHEGTDK